MGIAIGLIVFLFVPVQKKTDTASRKTEPTQTAAYRESGEIPAGQPAPEKGGEVTPERASLDSDTNQLPGMPVISLSSNANSSDLENIVLPPLPYCIYTGAYKNFKEAATTQSELDSNYLAAYIVPIEIKGNVAQSLFGVTQDGLWYRVLTGHFGSKQEARRTLAVMMKDLPGYQPEILRFPYALECGRFLVPEEARKLSERLDQKGVFHYTQDYPTSEGETLTRILAGCYFSEQGAKDQAGRLRGKGFDCRVTER